MEGLAMLSPKELPELVVIYRGFDVTDVVDATRALFDVGIRGFEVTFNSPSPAKSIEELNKIFGSEAHIGAGTIRTVNQVTEAVQAGATFLLSPNLDPEVIAATKAAGVLSIPGALTPTEIARAHMLGADIVKLFPLVPVGVAYVRQIREPLPDIPLFVSGGVTAEMGRDCLVAGCISVGVGLGLLDRAAAEKRDWNTVALAAQQYLATLADRPTQVSR